MELRARRPTKTVAAISMTAFAWMTLQDARDFSVTMPLNPAFADAPAYSGGTVIARGPYHAMPPNGRIDVTAVRRLIGGAALPDS